MDSSVLHPDRAVPALHDVPGELQGQRHLYPPAVAADQSAVVALGKLAFAFKLILPYIANTVLSP